LDSIISFDDFVGNDSEISKLVSWIGEYFFEKTAQTSRYGIITAQTGNGKTSLASALADGHKLPLLRIDPGDVSSMEDVNRFLKEINLVMLGRKSSRKIVLIDDIDEFAYPFRKALMTRSVKVSTNPILFTCKSTFKLGSNFVDKGITCRLKKPTRDEMIGLINRVTKKNSFSVDSKKMEQILRNCVSVRSSLNSIFTPDISSVETTEQNMFKKIKAVSEGNLLESVDNYTMKVITYNCKRLPDILYTTKLVTTSDTNFKSDTHPFLLVGRRLDISGRISFPPSLEKPKRPTKTETLLCHSLHVSLHVLRSEYKFLNTEDEKEKVVKKKKKKKEKPKLRGTVKSLENFF